LEIFGKEEISTQKPGQRGRGRKREREGEAPLGEEEYGNTAARK